MEDWKHFEVYEISESELEALERGSLESIFLNLAIAVLSVAISISTSLETATFHDDRTFYVFVIVVVVGYLAGMTFSMLWLNSRRSLKNVSAEIRSRIPPDGAQENGDDAPSERH